jgi:hypothetical protein
MSKYRSTKAMLDDIVFDSKRERQRYSELKLLERAGKIKDLSLQHKFELQPSFKKNGKTFRAINYIADFVYFDLERMEIVVEDVKGFRTKEYLLKRKLFEFKYSELTITEI